MTIPKRYSNEELIRAIERYPWWSGARMTLLRESGSAEAEDQIAMLHTTLRPLAAIATTDINIERLTHLTTDDLIARFLKREDLAERNIEDDEDMVSEELAEIYLNQGFYDAAIDTYRKLSLLNSEKSIYFAGLIAQLERKQNQKE